MKGNKKKGWWGGQNGLTLRANLNMHSGTRRLLGGAAASLASAAGSSA